jgi:hypothetical protein
MTFIQQELIFEAELTNIAADVLLNETQIRSLFSRMRWLVIALIPVIIIIRILFTSSCLFIGSITNENRVGTKFSDMFNIALKSDVIMVLYACFNFLLVINMSFSAPQEIYKYTSLLCLVDINVTDTWLMIPLISINIFEVLYWFFLAKLLSVNYNETFTNSFKFILSTYGVGFLIYVLLMMFLTLYIGL